MTPWKWALSVMVAGAIGWTFGRWDGVLSEKIKNAKKELEELDAARPGGGRRE